MNDTDKYEPTRIDWVLHNTREHTSDGWRKLSKSLIELSDDDRELIANAPLLLAEVERLREGIKQLIVKVEGMSTGYRKPIVKVLKEMIE